MSTNTKPSEYLNAILSGELHPAEATPAIQSWLEFVCYRIAIDLYELPEPEQRERAKAYPEPVLEITRKWYAAHHRTRLARRYRQS